MMPNDEHATGHLHVFCVNRSAAFLEFLLDLLQEEHFVVTTTNSHATAFVQIAVAMPHLVIFDVPPGDDESLELLKRISTDESTKLIPLLITSTDPATIDRINAEPALYRPQQCLVKPFDVAELLSAISSLVRPI
jgi:DNA-binding response OmpR family regulator